MKNLFILKKIIEDKELSDEAFSVWCGLRNIMQKDKKEYFVSYSMIGYCLYGERHLTRSEISDIKNGYNELKEKEHIKEIFSINYESKIVDLSKLYYKQGKDYFSDLTNEEMVEIMNLSNIGKIKNCKLLRYFACMVSTFNRSNSVTIEHRGKIGGISLEAISNLVGITSKTANKYNKILEDNHLLYVIRHKDFFQGTNAKGKSELREIPNTYCRYCDRNLAINFVSNIHGYRYMEDTMKFKTIKANENRSFAQKYINLCKGKKYDIETIKVIYNYCLEWNKNQLAYHNEQVSRGYDHKLIKKDMSVFNEYLEYICNTSIHT